MKYKIIGMTFIMFSVGCSVSSNSTGNPGTSTILTERGTVPFSANVSTPSSSVPPTTNTTIATTLPPTTTPSSTTSANLPAELKASEYSSLLSNLAVEAECHRLSYDRDDWPHWSSVEGEISNIRHYVLTASSLREVSYSNNGNVIDGEWISAYDGYSHSNPRKFDIDHIVPLAEAHDSGGCAWTRDRRKLFANDLGGLIAVSASSNRSKSDKDPQNWMPPVQSYHCEYLTNWMNVKHKWELSVDVAEHNFLESYKDDCST